MIEYCEVGVDLGETCDKVAMQIVHEPYTPGRFKVYACGEHAKSLIDFGYKAGITLDDNPAANFAQIEG